ncbi:tRNA 4-thiouridine(8) synthase ThiI [Candidatus Magnetomoraceae bacterium gMMP-15]
MILQSKKIRGLGLCSGGLDSILSALILRKQGIEVEWVSFETPFFSAEKAVKAAAFTNIPLKVERITDIYLKMLKNPPCGYGKYMNPCLDCHALMFRLAGEMMKKRGFDFLFSGEVMGQRPMSQTKPSLRYVEKNSGFKDYILRPLSAKKLPETIPEMQGLVNRNELLDITGRSRKIQIKLAREFGIIDYPNPGGGCLLTDAGYCRRLKDLFDHQDIYLERDMEILKYGRHFRLNDRVKIIVGRTQQDNENIMKFFDPNLDILIDSVNFPSPTILIPYIGSKFRGRKAVEIEAVQKAASLCIGYSKAPNDKATIVSVDSPESHEEIKVYGIDTKIFKEFLI